MDADEFRDYILGFIFYKYLSEKMQNHADHILEEDKLLYVNIDESSEEGQEYLEAIKEDSIEQLGYFLKPSELFSAVANCGSGEHNTSYSKILATFLIVLSKAPWGKRVKMPLKKMSG